MRLTRGAREIFRGVRLLVLVGVAFVSGISSHALASVEFEFIDMGELDSQGVGVSLTARDGRTGEDVDLTTVEIRGQDGSLASAGAMHLTNTLAGNGGDALGVQSATNVGAFVNDARDFNPGEAWTFSFDQDVALIDIDFAGWGDDSSEVTLTFSDGTPAVVLSGDVPGDTFTVNTFVAEGTEVTMALTNTTGDQEVRLKTILVNIPREGTIYDGIDGGQWTTTDFDFLEMGLPVMFENGDDAIFPFGSGNLAIRLEEAGIEAGDIVWENTRGGRLRFIGGDLICETILNEDDGAVAMSNSTTITGIATFEENGELEIWDGGSLTFALLSLAGDSVLELREGGTYDNPDGVITLGEGGADIRNEIDMTLGPIVNMIDNNPLEISRDGNLTLAGGLGTETTGPVFLNIASGSVTLAGSGQINIGNPTFSDPHVFNGPLIMAGPTLELHGSLISGEGSILVAASSLMSPRFNGGVNIVSVPVEVAGGQVLSVDPALGLNTLSFVDGITGDGGLTKLGNGLCVISAADEGYAGDTTVEAGTLRFESAVLSDSGSVSLSGNGRLELRSGAGDTVRSLFIDGVQVEAGTYGGSQAATDLDVVNDDHFTSASNSTGWLIVLEDPPSSDFLSWAAGFDLVGGPDDDDDGDGIVNRAEYAFGLTPNDRASVNAFVSPLGGGGVFVYTRRNPTTNATGLSYRYEYSSDLQNWIDGASFTENGDGAALVETVEVTIPVALRSRAEIFVRVIAF